VLLLLLGAAGQVDGQAAGWPLLLGLLCCFFVIGIRDLDDFVLFATPDL
jgi:hypothetical protein